MSRAAAAEEATVRRPLLLVRAAVKDVRYWTQPPVRTATVRAAASAPSASWRLTARVLPCSARAHTEKSYFLPCSTRTPVLYPEFVTDEPAASER
ncbi:hypothetical protein QFZ56_001629 [Streptomyces achromogenes]|uniref:Uncharacterized protein n=1 Tax=Streptomyces achromogenes TaxID=67255 RepID=A0ABU0PX10_STRAH|nr:hypothetical protein [Streptomyces achromogenes]